VCRARAEDPGAFVSSNESLMPRLRHLRRSQGTCQGIKLDSRRGAKLIRVKRDCAEGYHVLPDDGGRFGCGCPEIALWTVSQQSPTTRPMPRALGHLACLRQVVSRVGLGKVWTAFGDRQKRDQADKHREDRGFDQRANTPAGTNRVNCGQARAQHRVRIRNGQAHRQV
jgi:hypothetical protein